MKDLNTTDRDKDTSLRSMLIIILIILIIAVSIIIPLLFAEEDAVNVREEIELEGTKISIEYPNKEGYMIKRLDENSEIKSEIPKVEISQENGDYTIDVVVNTSTLKKEYMGDFKKYKEVKTSGLEAQDISTEMGVEGFGFYNSNHDEYEVIFPGNNLETINITVKPMVKGKDSNGMTIFNRPNVQEIIKSIKI